MSLMDFFKNLFGGKSEEVKDTAAEGAMPEMGMPAPETPEEAAPEAAEEGGMGEEEDQSL